MSLPPPTKIGTCCGLRVSFSQPPFLPQVSKKKRFSVIPTGGMWAKKRSSVLFLLLFPKFAAPLPSRTFKNHTRGSPETRRRHFLNTLRIPPKHAAGSLPNMLRASLKQAAGIPGTHCRYPYDSLQVPFKYVATAFKNAAGRPFWLLKLLRTILCHRETEVHACGSSISASPTTAATHWPVWRWFPHLRVV